MSGVENFDTALADLSTGAPPTDFADRALRTLTRRNRIRAVATTGAAAASVAAVAVAAIALHAPPPTAGGTPTATGPPRLTTSGTPAPAHTEQTPVPGQPTNQPTVLAATGPVALLSYNLHSADVSDPWYVWDTEQHRYLRTYNWVRPSPDAKWGLVFHGDQLAVAPWADAVHERNLRWTRVTAPTKWSASGKIITVDAGQHRITWTDPATGGKASVPWPAQLRDSSQVMYGFGGLADDQVMLWSYGKAARTTTTVWTVNRAGQLTGSAVITGAPVPRPFFDMVDPAAGPLEHAELNARPMYSGEPSPDGKYINTREGVVLDVTQHRVAFRITVPGGYQAMPVGWLPNGNVAIWIGNDQPHGAPMRLDIFNVSGAKVGTIPIKTIPAYGTSGFATAADLATLGS